VASGLFVISAGALCSSNYLSAAGVAFTFWLIAASVGFVYHTISVPAKPESDDVSSVLNPSNWWELHEYFDETEDGMCYPLFRKTDEDARRKLPTTARHVITIFATNEREARRLKHKHLNWPWQEGQKV
jgi:hypothetical protein